MPPIKKIKIAAVPVSQPSLDSWVSLKAKPAGTSSSSSSAGASSSSTGPSLAELDAELITFSDPVTEKDSIFLAVTFPLHAPPSSHKIQSLFNLHCSPPRHPSLPAVFNRDPGILPTHRMYAWRALGLKQDRNGTKGAGDFEVKEGSDDDGEKYGGDRILKVLRDRGGVDVLTVCCRWYGGTMIGPIRFQLIENTTKQSLLAHLVLADLQPRKIELLARDARIAQLRSLLPAPTPPPSSDPPPSSSQPTPTKDPYTGLTSEKSDRLLFARGKTLEGLEKRVKELGPSVATEGSGRQDLKRRVEEVLAAEGEAVMEEEDAFTRMERRLAEKAREKEKEALPSFAKKKKVAEEVVVISSEEEEEEEEEEEGGGSGKAGEDEAVERGGDASEGVDG